MVNVLFGETVKTRFFTRFFNDHAMNNLLDLCRGAALGFMSYILLKLFVKRYSLTQAINQFMTVFETRSAQFNNPVKTGRPLADGTSGRTETTLRRYEEDGCPGDINYYIRLVYFC
ncbi:hypothetical protein AMJ80_00445 [bacterium SM23_31]|nr:MAG: hypothetical protein AMJ80_00445 [bacterium SM23_31]